MAIGEKLWEGKAKSTMMAIKGASADGVSIESTWMAQLKGMGKAKGLDGAVTFTGNTMMAPSGVGNSLGTGMLNFMTGDMAVVKGSGVGMVEMGKSKSVGVWSFMSMSPKLAWMNTAVALVTLDGDPSWMEFDVVIWAWK
jgi:hypothetical protein